MVMLLVSVVSAMGIHKYGQIPPKQNQLPPSRKAQIVHQL